MIFTTHYRCKNGMRFVPQDWENGNPNLCGNCGRPLSRHKAVRRQEAGEINPPFPLLADMADPTVAPPPRNLP